jgi:predicted transglutaminase-like cysteine proteinase
MSRAFASSLAVMVVCASAQAAGIDLSQPPPRLGSPMAPIGQSTPPAAFLDFCERTPKECAPDATPASPEELTGARWRDLVEVNGIANVTVTARPDVETFGEAGYWSIPKKYGDCDEFALLKQQMLHERGWPFGNLLMTVVRTPSGEGHAILTVRTTKGDLVLDNLSSKIVPWSETSYEFYKRQSPTDPKVWVALAPIALKADDLVFTARFERH